MLGHRLRCWPNINVFAEKTEGVIQQLVSYQMVPQVGLYV